VAKYEREIDINNPCKEEIESINQKIDILTKRKLVLLKRENKIKKCAGLLFKGGEELCGAAKHAFEALGFECSDKTKWLDDDKISFCLTSHGKMIAIVQVTDTEAGPLPESYFETLKQIDGLEKFENKPKMILVVNADRINPPTTRSECFEDGILESSNEHEYSLVPSTELFDAVTYAWYKFNSELHDTIKASLRKDIIGCIGQFEIDERKYLIKKTVNKPQPVSSK
jgi:hypothetical protein